MGSHSETGTRPERPITDAHYLVWAGAWDWLFTVSLAGGKCGVDGVPTVRRRSLYGRIGGVAWSGDSRFLRLYYVTVCVDLQDVTGCAYGLERRVDWRSHNVATVYPREI